MAVVGVFTVVIGALYGGDDWCFCCCGFGNGFVVGIWLDLVGFVLICPRRIRPNTCDIPVVLVVQE